MKTNDRTKRICPYCNKEFYERPAISRVDNESLICPDCGTKEALESIGVNLQEQDKILEIIHRYYKPEN